LVDGKTLPFFLVCLTSSLIKTQIPKLFPANEKAPSGAFCKVCARGFVMVERPCDSSHELPLLRAGGKQRSMRRPVVALAIAGACLVALLVVAAQPSGGDNSVVLEDTSQEAYHNRASRWSHDKVRIGKKWE
jgi:hypothetical protein